MSHLLKVVEGTVKLVITVDPLLVIKLNLRQERDREHRGEGEDYRVATSMVDK